jgi:hypothetical protein
MNACPHLTALLRTARRRLALRRAGTLFRRLAWGAGGVLLLAGLVHAGLRPLPVGPVLAGALLPLGLAPVLCAALRRPTDRQAARCLDESYGGRGLAATALELRARPGLSPMARYVLESAEKASVEWRTRPDRLPVPEPWPHAWMPLGLVLAGTFLLLAGGKDSGPPAEPFRSVADESSRTAEAPPPAPRRPFGSSRAAEARRGKPSPEKGGGLQFAQSSRLAGEQAGAQRESRSAPPEPPIPPAAGTGAPSEPSAAASAGSGRSGAGQGGRKSAGAGSGAEAETRAASLEDARLDVRYTDLERRGGEESAGGRRALKPSAAGSGAKGRGAPGAAPEQAKGGAWNPPLGLRPYLNRYFQTLAQQGH